MKVSFSGNYTVDFIAKEFKKRSGYDVVVQDYCQYYQDIIFKESTLYRAGSEFDVLLLDGNLLLNIGDEELIKDHIKEVVQSYLNNSKYGYLLISNIYLVNQVNSIWNYNHENNLKKLQTSINLFLNELSSLNNQIYIIDLLSLIEFHGETTLYDNNLWIYGKNRFSKKGLYLFAKEIFSLVNSILSNTKKCLVLDLDNTLWGGVAGEDGITGIELSTDGAGYIYRKFQEEIKKIKSKGILLAICSKNNLEDAKYIFDNHQYMILKWDDFIVHKVNWNPKNLNLKEIAYELNIGEDSLVFIDDNPMEREMVSKNTECTVPDFPENVADLLNFISDVDKEFFSRQTVTAEDLTKSEQYIENRKRTEFENSFENYEEFVNSLNVELIIFKNSIDQVDRISQMTQKTNQFNFTTRRYSAEQIKEFMESDDSMVFSGQVKDRFGDFGIVILAVIIEQENQYTIDTFLMSCRVIGKLVENIFIQEISKQLKPGKKIEIRYIPTKKNVLVETKMDEIGFELIEKKENGEKRYTAVNPFTFESNIKMTVSYE